MTALHALLLVLVALCASSVHAQSDYPNKPIRIIVPYPPGSGTDFTGREVGAAFSRALGQPVVIDNRGGAAATIGHALGAKAAPDGYTLFSLSSAQVLAPHVRKVINYDPVKDFKPIAMAATSAYFLAVHPSVPAKNVAELVALAKAKPGGMSYASSGAGAGPHLTSSLFLAVAGIDITHVPYRGEGPALQDVIAGRIDYMCTTMQSGAAQANQGAVKGIAVMAERRAAVVPNIPTTKEQGVDGVEAVVWNGFLFPKGTPKPIIDKMHQAIETMMSKPDMVKKLQDAGLEIQPKEQRTPEYFAKFLKEDVERWGKVIKAANISMD